MAKPLKRSLGDWRSLEGTYTGSEPGLAVAGAIFSRTPGVKGVVPEMGESGDPSAGAGNRSWLRAGAVAVGLPWDCTADCENGGVALGYTRATIVAAAWPGVALGSAATGVSVAAPTLAVAVTVGVAVGTVAVGRIAVG